MPVKQDLVAFACVQRDRRNMLAEPQAVWVSAIATISSAEAYGAVAVDGRDLSPAARGAPRRGVDCGSIRCRRMPFVNGRVPIGDAVLLGTRVCAPGQRLQCFCRRQQLRGASGRISSISAACSGLGAILASDNPFRSICQARVMSAGEAFAMPRPRTRSASGTCGPSLAPGASFNRVSQCVRSSRSSSRVNGSAPERYCSSRSASAVGASHHCVENIEAKRAVNQAQHFADRILLDGAHTMCDRLVKRDSASHAAVGGSRQQLQRCGAIVTCSRSATRARCCISSAASTRRRSKRWQRDKTVTGTLRISVVAKMNLACSGGSSSVSERVERLFRACALRR